MNIKTDKTITVIGAGTMGTKIAACYDKAGYKVNLYSIPEDSLTKARQIIGDSNINYTTDLKEALKNTFYVVEAIPEVADMKKELFVELDSLLPLDVFISSNTSYLNIFEIMPERRLEKTCIVHWFAPADILPLVEIIKGEKTSDDTMSVMNELHINCGKTPVIMKKYIPGFIVNRLQSAMTREIVNLISNDYCTPEAIDLAVKTSLMPRGLLLGVVQRMDFGGIDTVAHGIENESFVPSPISKNDNAVTKLAKEGNIGIKSGKGFYDYDGSDYSELMKARDEKLKESVALAKEFMKTPFGKPRKDI